MATVKLLVVGGGGGGGGSWSDSGQTSAGGGGGGGEYYYSATYSITAGAYTVTIGGGGNGGNASGQDGTSGSNTVFNSTITATGGGKGGASNGTLTGTNGGSGGGGGCARQVSRTYGGGGGGASQVGGDAPTLTNNGGSHTGSYTGFAGGKGGAGDIATGGSAYATSIANPITGAYVSGGGGGGGGGTSASGGAGANGGGGNGGSGSNAGTDANGGYGMGGGGGASSGAVGQGGGAGNAGVVIVSYPLGTFGTSTGGTISTVGSETVHTFTSNGTLVLTTPTITTQAVSSVSYNDLVGNGNITDVGTGVATRRGFCYAVGSSGDPTTSDSTAYDDGSFSTGAFTKSITGLTPGTAYGFRAYMILAGVTYYGTSVTGTTTAAVAPTVITDTIFPFIASLNMEGSIDAQGGTSSRVGFAYKVGTTGDPTTSDSVIYEDGTYDPGSFSFTLSGLPSDTSFRVRAYAINPAGTAYGDTAQTKTLISQGNSGFLTILLNK